MTRLLSFVALLLVAPLLGADEAAPSEKKEGEAKWQALFNGKDLEGWKSTEFGGEGEVAVKEGAIVLNAGSDMTGITYTGKLPKVNYELVVEAQRLEGVDFFSAITFPVGESHVSFVPGGWAGSVTGISSINDRDASDNETTQFTAFKDKTWYKFNIRVTGERILIAVDGKHLLDVEHNGKKLSTRGEVDLSKPLGISTWNTKGAVKTIKLREMTPEEVKSTNEEK